MCSFPISLAFINVYLQGSTVSFIRTRLLTFLFWIFFFVFFFFFLGGQDSLGLIGLWSERTKYDVQ